MNFINHVKQEVLLGREMNKLHDYSNSRGHDFYHIYRSIGLFPTHQTDVAAGLGVMILDDLFRAGVSLPVFGLDVTKVLCAGLAYLGSDPALWRFHGPADAIEAFRSWLWDAPEPIRKRRVQDILYIQERPANRFLLLSRDHAVTTTDNIAEDLASVGQRFTTVIDAFEIANELKRRRPGALFTFTVKEVG